MRVEFEHALVESKGRLARVTFRRPERLNAFHYPAVRDLDAIGRLLTADGEIHVVALQGEGRAFSTGIDLKDLADGLIDERYFSLWDTAVRHFEVMDKLVICLMHGYAVGGGLQLGLGCDIRIATPTARFSLPAVKEGLIPGLGTLRLARYIGLGRAKTFALWGEFMEADEALRIGLVDRLVSDATMQAEFDEYVDKTLAVASQGARFTKQCLALMPDMDWQEAFDLYMDLQRKGLDSADFREAMTAYKANRPPQWS
ncbi:MAG: enoyl-CoA hydratase/isomerase family protein [Reyranellaceae bacterium]